MPAALMRLAMVRADMAKILSSGSAPAGLMRCRQVAGGREVGHVAARFLVGLRARDVQPCGAIGFCGQVLPLKGCGFAAAQEAIAHRAHERDGHVSAPGGGLGRLHAVSAPLARSAGSGFNLGDHLAGESSDLRGLLGALPPQAPHGLGYGGVAGKIGRAGFAAGVAQGGQLLLPPRVRMLAGGSGEEGQERERMVPGAAGGARPGRVGCKAQGIGFDRGTA